MMGWRPASPPDPIRTVTPSPTVPRRSRRTTAARRGALVVAAALTLATPAAASAAPAATSEPGAVPRGAAKVSRGVCTTSPTDAAERAASFTVRVRDLPPSTAYGFSVKLQERLPGERWKTLRGAAVPTGFGAFETARTGAPSMSRRINVQGLHPGSSYRLRVTYRWSTAERTRTARRTSSSCVVKDARPDVGLTGAFGWQPSVAGGEVAYRIGIRADGLGDLKGVDVPIEVRQGSSVLATGVLRPGGASETVLLPGRRCVQGPPVTVELDPQGLVEDRIAADDLLTTACAPVGR